MFDMINIFEVFLPQLLRYPNPTDPLNGEAASLLLREPKGYDVKVKGMEDTSTVPRPPRGANHISPQSTYRNTQPKKLSTKPARKARTTTICRRWLVSGMTTTSRPDRWTTCS
jgi:hypothetical protein